MIFQEDVEDSFRFYYYYNPPVLMRFVTIYVELWNQNMKIDSEFLCILRKKLQLLNFDLFNE